MPKPKKTKKAKRLIEGREGVEMPIAAKCLCNGCGWAGLFLPGDPDEPIPSSCPECNRELVQKVVTAPMHCPRCKGVRSVTSVTSVARLQVCADCAGRGLSVQMTAKVS